MNDKKTEAEIAEEEIITAGADAEAEAIAEALRSTP